MPNHSRLLFNSWVIFKRRLAHLIHNILNTPRPEQTNPLRGWLILLVIFFIFSLIFGFIWISYAYQANQAAQSLQENTHKIAAHIQRRLLQDVQTAQLLPYLASKPYITNQIPPLNILNKPSNNVLNVALTHKIEQLQADHPDILRVQYWYSSDLAECALQCKLLHDSISKAAPRNITSYAAHILPELSKQTLASLTPNQSELFSLPYRFPYAIKPSDETLDTNTYVIDLWVMQPQNVGYRYIRFTYSLQRVLSQMTKNFGLDTDTAFLLPNGQLIVENKLFERQFSGQLASSLFKLPGLSLQFKLIDFAASASFFPNFLSNTVSSLAALLIFSVLLLCIDVRKRLQVQKVLEQQYALQKAMEDSLVTGLRARDFLGVTIYVNPALCRMLGFSMAELVGCPLPMPYWPPEEIPEYQARYKQPLPIDNIHSNGFETVFMRKDGIRFPVLIFEAPLLNAQGIQTGWMSSIVDTTYQKNMELITRQQQEQLAQQARLATMGELSTTLSHELNQPLAAISSYATATLNMLESGMVQANDVQEGLLRISKQAQRAGLVIRSIHNFVRRKTSVREVVDLRIVLKGIYPLIELQAKHLKTQVVLKSAQTIPNVLIDRLMLEQVMLNLTRNAMEAMKHLPINSRRLSINIQHCQTDAENQAKSTVRFCVSDCGDGVTDELGKNIFIAFFSTKEDGMGMGLAICRTVIEAAHGYLWYENTDSGCDFIVELPAYPLITV